MKEYSHFKVKVEDHIAQVSFNRPEKANALVLEAWEEMQAIFENIDQNPEIRVVVLTGEGKHFCAGIDLSLLMNIQRFNEDNCEGRKREKLRQFILKLQNTITSIEKCRKPVLAAIHNGCIGGGVDIVTACDMRYSTKDAYFTIKEVDMGLVADIGTLQRLPKIIAPGMVAEMAYTGRKVSGVEAKEMGLVNNHFEDKETMLVEVFKIATVIAKKSPLVIRGTKEMIHYSRNHTIEESLNYMSVWNAAMLVSNDLMEAFQSNMEKREAKFKD